MMALAESGGSKSARSALEIESQVIIPWSDKGVCHYDANTLPTCLSAIFRLHQRKGIFVVTGVAQSRILET
ncbi:hypothetical protein ACN47E_002719 [Coniothyrium glycines]